jgi:hypothetical protein
MGGQVGQVSSTLLTATIKEAPSLFGVLLMAPIPHWPCKKAYPSAPCLLQGEALRGLLQPFTRRRCESRPQPTSLLLPKVYESPVLVTIAV